MKLLNNALYLASPHCDDRPDEYNVSLLVIHNISLPPEQFGGDYIEQFFQGKLDYSAHPYFETIKDLKVSSHVLIKRDGAVVQFVPLNKRAWHAGDSAYDGVDKCNDYSIGIELEGADNVLFEPEQYKALVGVTKQIMQQYPLITQERITGHSHIAPGRKTDPGPAFDWEHYFALLSEDCKE